MMLPFKLFEPAETRVAAAQAVNAKFREKYFSVKLHSTSNNHEL
jgi:hypothetical protein